MMVNVYKCILQVILDKMSQMVNVTRTLAKFNLLERGASVIKHLRKCGAGLKHQNEK